MTKYTIAARVEFLTDVTVEATTTEEAQKMFAAGYWINDGLAQAKSKMWTALGAPRKQTNHPNGGKA